MDIKINPANYNMLNGNKSTWDYWDDTYSGRGNTSQDNAPLSGGLGDLTDTTPKLSISDVNLFESHNGTTTAKFIVTLKGKAVNPVKVLYSTANKTTKAGSLTFKASNKTQQKQTISVAVQGDKLFENNETFFVILSCATNAVISDSRGVGTIRNDDLNNLFAQNDISFGRGNSLDISKYQEITGSDRSSLMPSLYQSPNLDGLSGSINSFVNAEAVVI